MRYPVGGAQTSYMKNAHVSNRVAEWKGTVIK